jgi:hypothetical protein
MVGQAGRDKYDGGQGVDTVFYDASDLGWYLVEVANAGSPSKK